VSQQRLSQEMPQSPHPQDQTFLKYVGSAVRNYRLSKQLDIEYLSANSGLPTAMICDLENGVADIYLNDLSSIASALGIDTIALVEIPTN
jgi:hypothetical protein